MKLLNSAESPPEVRKAIAKKNRLMTRLASTKTGSDYATTTGLKLGDELVIMKPQVAKYYAGGFMHECCKADGTGVLVDHTWYHMFWLPDAALTDPPAKKKTSAARQVKQGA